MVRATNAVAAHRRIKRIMKRAKGFWGDRKNHLRQTTDAVMRAMAYSYMHRKQKKRDFRSLWITRISASAKMNGISYSALIHGMQKAGIEVNRKMLSDLAVNDPAAFAAIVEQAKQSLVMA